MRKLTSQNLLEVNYFTENLRYERDVMIFITNYPIS